MPEHKYRLVVEGELGAVTSAAFEGMSFTHESGRTAIVGGVRDQAHLQGLLQRVTDLGLTLLSVDVIDEHKGRR